MLDTLVKQETYEYKVTAEGKLEKNIDDNLIKAYYKQSKIVTTNI